jgi:NADH/NAD ratio-sensing transcriptional regulator Rex
MDHAAERRLKNGVKNVLTELEESRVDQRVSWAVLSSRSGVSESTCRRVLAYTSKTVNFLSVCKVAAALGHRISFRERN